jgi:2-polyprenyl-6-methoxyphenol hydroxylase-like FAD-dependent oxidoreductase
MVKCFGYLSEAVKANSFLSATPPHAGQGASQALEDAAYLAHLLRQLLSSTKSDVLTTMELRSVLSAFQEARQKRVNEIIAEANKRGDGKRELSAIGMFIKKWSMKIFLTFIMKESWLDGWFGYEVPGIHEWS